MLKAYEKVTELCKDNPFYEHCDKEGGRNWRIFWEKERSIYARNKVEESVK